MAARTRRGRGVEGKSGTRYELTGEGGDRILDLLPAQARGGTWCEHRVVLNGMFWVLNSGAQWRDTPARHGKWERVYGRSRRWRAKGSSSAISAGCTLPWKNTVGSIGASSTSTARACGPIAPLRGPGTQPTGRARRQRRVTIPRTRWHEAQSCDGRLRRAIRDARDRRTGARVEVVRGAHGHGADLTTTSSERRRWRQGVRLPAHPSVPSRSMHPGGHSDTIGSVSRTTQHDTVSAPYGRRALYRLPEGLPTRRHPTGEAHHALPCRRHYTHDSVLPAFSRSATQ